MSKLHFTLKEIANTMHLNILISNKCTRFKYTFKYLVNQYRTCDEGLIAYFRIRFGLCKIVNKLKFDQTKWVEEKLFNCIYMAEKNGIKSY